jgi:signal transduction histidine kinase
MSQTKQEIAIVIVAISCILIFMGIIFLFLIIYYKGKKRKIEFEKEQLRKEFEQQSLQSQLEIQEQTFSAISQEIHDNVGQILSLAKVQLNILDKQWENAPPLLKESRENIGRAMTDLRDIAKSLNADRIEQLKLVQAIELEAERLNKAKTFICKLEIIGNEQSIEGRKKLIVFRIIQEALNNVLKHAQATEVKIILDYTDENFRITIRDNGTGFDRLQPNNEGLGLRHIIKRTGLIGGVAVISSEHKKGTTITLNIPYAR